ncbi:hypothetical protein RIF29_15344 [Crotalaria pallida]|uniref:Uncharacterized protein n=1 Tax=Crotalaria pallida TaxID=3830 RepID=A0AAN9FH30_CROPI
MEINGDSRSAINSDDAGGGSRNSRLSECLWLIRERNREREREMTKRHEDNIEIVVDNSFTSNNWKNKSSS